MSAVLQSIVELTDRVQTAVQDGDWAHAHELDVERRTLLESLLADAAAVASAAELGAVLADLERRSRHLIGEVQHHQRRILREASMVKTGHDAAAAYGDTQR